MHITHTQGDSKRMVQTLRSGEQATTNKFSIEN